MNGLESTPLGGFLAIVGMVAALAAGIYLAILVRRGLNKFYAHERTQLIEAQMRQDIIDGQTQKKVANKILREAGEKP